MRIKAFSFVEILVAVVCLAMVMIPLTTMFSFSSSGTIQNRNDLLARQHAANILDYAYSLAYNDAFLEPVSQKSVPTVSFNSGSEELVLDMEEIFTRSVSIEEVKPVDWKYSYKLIKVAVTWNEGKTEDEELIMTGVISNAGS
ncbi:MAG: type IV pilus modification PilV family protein [Candidatus Rifleibacteriota bacterium]